MGVVTGGGRGQEPPTPLNTLPLLLLLLFLRLHTLKAVPGGESGIVPGTLFDTSNSRLCAPENQLSNLTFGSPASYNFTVCALVRPLGKDSNGRFFYYSINNITIIAQVMRSKLSVVVLQTHVLFNASVVNDVWNPICFGYDTNRNEAWAALQGKFLGVSHTQHINITSKISAVCIRSPKCTQRKCLQGYITSVSIQEGMPDMQDQDIATCNAVVRASIASHTVDATWVGKYGLWRTEYKHEELCSNSIQNVWITERGSYADHLKTCVVFGGHLVKEQATSVLVKEAVNAPKKCITDNISHISWLGHDLQEDRPLNAQCPVLLINGTIGSQFCIRELECSLCQVAKWMRFTLYGFIHDFDRYYFLRSLPDGNFLFEGLHASLISLKGNSWVLSSNLHSRFWQLTEGFQAVGRHSWHSGNRNTLLTLTSCTVLQFSSHDGYCLPRNQRCNRLVEFADGSDEVECLERVIGKGLNYESILPPSHKDNEMVNVYYMFNMENIKEITTKTGVAKIDLRGILQWADSRLHLWDIGDAGYTIFNCNDIWHPKLGIRAGYENRGEEINFQVYTSECIVIHSSDHRHYAMDDPYMGRFVHGKDDNLTMYMQLLLELPCNFELHRYPFGFHQCNASFYLKSFDTEKTLHPLIESGEINYGGNTNLLDYQLLKITFEKKGTYATLTLHLKSQCDYHILNSFSPSALMFIISYATLFFPLVSSSDRIMVSLTALLVLAALFAQASDSYVKTPYYKLIDIWYAVIIGLCFIVVMVNMVVGCLQHTPGCSQVSKENEDNSTHVTLSLTPRKVTIINMVCKVAILTLFVTWITVFSLFATNVI